MSFVVDQIRVFDGQLDRLQLATAATLTLTTQEAHDATKSARIAHLQALIKSLSTTASAKSALVPRARILDIVAQAGIAGTAGTAGTTGSTETAGSADASYERELEWLLLGKATAQAYGAVLTTILEQTLPLDADVGYWDDMLSTYRFAGLYSVQTSPLRLWAWSRDIYHAVRARRTPTADGWRQFYRLVRDAVHERSIADIQRRVVSPLALVRNEGRRKRAALRQMRLLNANALGLLVADGLAGHTLHDDAFASPPAVTATATAPRWKALVSKSIALMDAVVDTVNTPNLSVDAFDASVAAITHDDPFYILHDTPAELKPADVAHRLQHLLRHALPAYTTQFNAGVRANGRPSRLVRYWLPATLLLVSSTTLFRIAINSREEIVSWIRELGQTVIDFWSNWVVEPTKKVVGTIRHDEDSEVSIMSKRSLESDRASLERMVIDFAIKNPDGPALNDTQIADIRARVREGDLTAVLRSYEKDIQRPVKGAIVGNLASALLIQVQKTKVDVELAMSGIDSILKSQELLFGFIGLTPGVLVSVGVYRWLRGAFSSRKGVRQWAKQGQLLLILRNIDRILVGARPTEAGEVSYKDHGLLLCEVHLLRQAAGEILPRRIFNEFLVEINELVDVHSGLARQQKVVERTRWAYSKWLA